MKWRNASQDILEPQFFSSMYNMVFDMEAIKMVLLNMICAVAILTTVCSLFLSCENFICRIFFLFLRLPSNFKLYSHCQILKLLAFGFANHYFTIVFFVSHMGRTLAPYFLCNSQDDGLHLVVPIQYSWCYSGCSTQISVVSEKLSCYSSI